MLFNFFKARTPLALTIALVTLGLSAPSQAVQVDSELVILVDAQTFSQSDFDFILNGVAESFEQQSFIDSVVSGPFGSIAASVVLFNSNNGETVGLPWMQLSSASDLQNFADSVRNVANSTPFGQVSYAGAIATGAAQLASSVYEGAVRQLTIVDDGTGFFQANPNATRNARDAALASSADVINGVIFDVAFQEQTAANYYNNYVVGGGGGVEVIGSPQGGPKSVEFTTAIASAITAQVSEPTIVAAEEAAAAAVPEPSTLVLLFGSLTFLVRRKR